MCCVSNASQGARPSSHLSGHISGNLTARPPAQYLASLQHELENPHLFHDVGWGVGGVDVVGFHGCPAENLS